MHKFKKRLICFINEVLTTATIAGLVGTGVFTTAAIASLGMEIIQKNSNLHFTQGRDWESQRNIFIGGALLAFSGFCGSRTLGSVIDLFEDY